MPRMLTVLAVAAALAGCGSSQPPAIPGVVQVVAGENFWGNIAAQIGGRHVRVIPILTSPTADPHLYESDVANAVAVAGAGLVIENGAGYDDFVSQLLGATRHRGRIVVSVQHALGATRPDVNPHLWYDIPRVPEVARAIEAALARLEPRHASAFAAGLKVLTPPGLAAAVEDGTDPGPDDTVVMDGLFTGHKVKVLLYNAQVVNAVTQHVRALARQSHIPVVGVTETMPPSYHRYQAWQLAQARAILHARGG